MEDLKLYSAEDVARTLGLNTDYVRKLARAKKIESVKIGNRVRFKEEHVRNYIEGGVSNE